MSRTVRVPAQIVRTESAALATREASIKAAQATKSAAVKTAKVAKAGAILGFCFVRTLVTGNTTKGN
jgi:hypothetical protein